MNSNQLDVTNYRYQQGFTLIEIAVVMVIIGLIMGSGVLMTQSMIRGMHAKEIMTIIKDISTGTRYFKEKYHYLPGDLPLAANDIPGISSSCNIATSVTTIGNGLIDTATEEQCFIEHLILAGFIKGDSTLTLKSRFGNIRITANNKVSGDAVNNSKVQLPSSILNVIEFSNLPWDIANEVDDTLDDGNFIDPTPNPPDITADSSLILAGNIQVDVNSTTAGNQSTTDMSSIIPFLAAPL
ncbi:MAG: prepilin-type N-terminal cleavage/methylation domain-containing protein [Magnetococcales bacterium]|nr:prepilin-type N-terminal cleavage/methylation domain-containing protein [Magnetococcales bacterium]